MDERESYDLRHRAVERNAWSKQAAWRGLVSAVARAAALAAPDEPTFDEYISDGFNVVSDCVHAINESVWNLEDNPDRDLKFWYHRSTLIYHGKKPNEPYIHKDYVQAAVANYLRLPFRVDQLDRLLLDLSMAQEILAFTDEMQPQLQRRLPRLLSWLLDNLISVVVGVGIAGVLFWLAPNSTVAIVIAWLILGVTALGALWSLIVFPLSYPAIRGADQKFVGICGAMLDAYTALGGQPASTKHIEERVNRATDAGVVWLAP